MNKSQTEETKMRNHEAAHVNIMHAVDWYDVGHIVILLANHRSGHLSFILICIYFKIKHWLLRPVCRSHCTPHSSKYHDVDVNSFNMILMSIIKRIILYVFVIVIVQEDLFFMLFFFMQFFFFIFPGLHNSGTVRHTTSRCKFLVCSSLNQKIYPVY